MLFNTREIGLGADDQSTTRPLASQQREQEAVEVAPLKRGQRGEDALPKTQEFLHKVHEFLSIICSVLGILSYFINISMY